MDNSRSESPELRTSDSDYEFWEEFEKKPHLSKKYKNHPNIQKLFDSLKKPSREDSKLQSIHLSEIISPKAENQAESKPEDPKVEALKEKVENLRLAKDEEISANSIIVRNKAKKEFQSTIGEISYKHKDEIKRLKAECMNLKTELNKKNLMIKDLRKLMGDMQFMVTKNRIKEKIVEKEYIVKEPPDDHLKTIESLKLQIESYKDIIESYKTAKEEAKNKQTLAENELESTLHFYKDKLKEAEQGKEDMKQQHNKEINELQNQLNEQKFKYEKELELKDLISQRQKTLISTLKTELKNTKTVLQNPKLRGCYQERLSDYMKEHSKSISEEEAPRHKSTSTKPPKNSTPIFTTGLKARKSNVSKSLDHSHNLANSGLFVSSNRSETPSPKANQTIFSRRNAMLLSINTKVSRNTSPLGYTRL